MNATPSAAPAAREERNALLAAAAACFCLLGGYYMLRPIREALALEVGVGNNLLMFGVVFAVSAALLPPYWWLVGRTPRTRLLWMVNSAFAAIFVVLALGLLAWPRDRTLSFVYFVALTSSNLLLIAVFWSAMSDVWRPELAKRFYGYVAAGGSAGALAGNLAVRGLVVDVGLPPLIIVACVFIVIAAALVSLARSELRRAPGGKRVPDGAIPVGGDAFDDLKRLATTPYLLGIAGIIIIGQTIGAFMYNEQGKYIASLYSSEVERAAMFANLEIAVNLLSLFFQAVVVTWLTRRGSVALSLSAMPAIDRRDFRGAGVHSQRRGVADHPGDSPRRGLRSRQGTARNAVHGVEPGEQVQEQEPDRHRPAARRGYRRPVAVPAGGEHRRRRHVMDVRGAVRGSARGDAHRWAAPLKRAAATRRASR